MSRSRLLATTSPLTARFMSVTSSGRSSIKRTMSLTPGKFVETPWLMCWRRIVLPVRGGATINARWPLPSGVSRSITRVVIGSEPVSSRSQDSGLIGVRTSKALTSLYCSGGMPSTSRTSFSRGPCWRRPAWTMPLSMTPSRRPNFSIMLPGTKGSVNSRR